MSGPPPADARAAALGPPRAHGPPVVAVRLRSLPEDFIVDEELGFAPDETGAHLLLRVRKRDANTAWVARQLARAADCAPAAVGFAGMKDRRALCTQWFSVPRPRDGRTLLGLAGEGFEVLEARPHGRKLPRGALAGNRFAVRLRADGEGGEALARRLGARLRAIAAHGVPNYFGPQRFGHGGANLAPAPAPRTRLELGLRLSAARSALFNAIAAARVREASWERLLPGDLANLDGRGSVFPVPQVDAALTERAARLEVHPTGALWGCVPPASSGVVHALECAVAAGLPDERALCERAALRAERRSLRLRVAELQWQPEREALVLRFFLRRGSFATSVLRELIEAPELTAPESAEGA